MFVTALTGDVGAGKSTMSRIWRDMGANVVGADEVAKEQWMRPEVARIASDRWGDDIYRPDGRPNYAKIAERAFSNEAEHRFTNELIHPRTRVEITRRVNALRGWIVAEIPLFFEAGGHDWVDHIVFVTAARAARAARNAARNWDEREILRREKNLLSSGEKQKKSDLVLSNDGDLAAWGRRARELGAHFLRVAGVCELQTCCGSFEEAQKIASLLVKKRLAACVNIGEVKSIYRWQGKTEADAEWSLTCKTTQSARREAIACIKVNHPYDLPAITATELCHADYATLAWVAENCV